MSQRLNAMMIMLALVGLVGVLHCAGGKELASDRPEWADRGGGFFQGVHGRAFHGVGAAGTMPSDDTRGRAADTQARSDLAGVFHANVQSLVKGCAAATPTSPGIPERHMSDVAGALVGMELSDAEIMARWYDPEERVQYSLAVLDLGMFRTRVSQLAELDEEVRDAVLAGAEYAFETLGKDTGR